MLLVTARLSDERSERSPGFGRGFIILLLSFLGPGRLHGPVLFEGPPVHFLDIIPGKDYYSWCTLH